MQMQVARVPTKAEVDEWLSKHGIEPDEDGSFVDRPYGAPPVPKSKIVENVRINCERRDVPNVIPSLFNPKTMVFVAGGPSLVHFEEQIRSRCLDPDYDVFTSNKTAQWMLERGMVPKYHIIIDPKPSKVEDVGFSDGRVTMMLGLQCDPAVFEAAKGRRVEKFLCASATDQSPSDVEVAQASLRPGDSLFGIGGGSMMGTRAVYLAEGLGYRKLEYFGFDGSVEVGPQGAVNYYAYDKGRGEVLLKTVAPDGREFMTTLTFNRQVDELFKILRETPGLDVVIHGDGLMAHALRLYREANRPVPYRISPEYLSLQRQMHDETPHYGISGAKYSGQVFLAAMQLHKKLGHCRVLDYGCGKQTLKAGIERTFPSIPNFWVQGYDPGIPGLDQEPTPSEIVVCGDVMEHIEEECVSAVLDHVQSLAKCLAIFVISMVPASKHLPDGRNAHITIKPRDWWLSHLRSRFALVESHFNGNELMVVGQSLSTI